MILFFVLIIDHALPGNENNKGVHPQALANVLALKNTEKQRISACIPTSVHDPVCSFYIGIHGHTGIQALILCFSVFFRARTLARACGSPHKG